MNPQPRWRDLECRCDLDYTCDKHRIIDDFLPACDAYRVTFYDCPELEEKAMTAALASGEGYQLNTTSGEHREAS
jgi:hypothetical protein